MKAILPAVALLCLLTGCTGSPVASSGLNDGNLRKSPDPLLGECGVKGLEPHQNYLVWQQAKVLLKNHALESHDWHGPQESNLYINVDPLHSKPCSGNTCGNIAQLILQRLNLQKCSFIHGEYPLDDTDFRGSDLTEASFKTTSLKGARFNSWKDSEKGTPIPTVLRKADFTGSDLSKANFSGADMTEVIFEPAALPDIASMSEALHLQQMTYAEDPSSLLSLRKAFRDQGFPEQDGQVNYAYHERLRTIYRGRCLDNFSKLDLRDSCVSYVGFTIVDWTCKYGLNLWRPIGIGAVSLVLFALIFFLFMHHPGRSGLYLSVAEGIDLDEEDRKNSKQIQVSTVVDDFAPGQSNSWVSRELHALSLALFFSLINAFNLGFKEADIGRWIRLLPPREFEFHAVGWPRTFAGIQALLTLYLVAVWVLCMVGHPFD